MSLIRRLFHQDTIALTLFSACIYYLAYLSSYQLSAYFEFSHATSWVYLPSGVRLLLVLILMESGAVGVFLGTLGIDYLVNQSNDHLYNWITAMIAGVSAYLGLLVAHQWLKLKEDLARMKSGQLMGVCLTFSVISPLMHQTWYTLRGETEAFWSSALVMSIGDLGGSIIVLGAIHWLWRLIRFLKPQ